MIELPGAWFEEHEDWSGDPQQDVSNALQENGTALRSVARSSPEASRSLEQGLKETLFAEQKHVVLSYPPHVSAVRAATCVASWLGLRAEALSEDIGGHVSVVTSGVGHRHDQAWHTDSTPWSVPNRWTVLGSLSNAAGAFAPATGVLPLARVAVALAANAPQSLVRLRSTPLEWRANFAGFTSLPAPILDAVFPRWVRPIVQEQLTDETDHMSEAVSNFEAVLNEVTSEAPVVAPGQILVFDNHAALHRGPHLDESSGRRLIRIKVGGVPV